LANDKEADMSWLWFTAILALLDCSSADTVHLNTGGKITGTITRVTFARKGKIVVLDRDQLAQVQRVHFGLGQDTISIGPEEWHGKLVEVRIRSIGGEMTFKRSKLSGIVKQLSEREKLLADHKAKLKKLAEDDAKGWYLLAAWAEKSRLRREALSAARTSLDIDPEHPHHADAHRMLGHLLKNGQWLTPAEVRDLEEMAKKDKEREMRAKGFVRVGPRWVTVEERERIEEIKERILDAEKSAKRQVEDWAEAKLDVVQREHRDLRNRLKEAPSRYGSAKALRNEHYGHGDSSERRGLEGMDRYKEEMKTLPGKLRAATTRVNTAKTALKSKVDKISRAAHNAAIRLIRSVEAGEKIDDAKIEREITPGDLD